MRSSPHPVSQILQLPLSSVCLLQSEVALLQPLRRPRPARPVVRPAAVPALRRFKQLGGSVEEFVRPACEILDGGQGARVGGVEIDLTGFCKRVSRVRSISNETPEEQVYQ